MRSRSRRKPVFVLLVVGLIVVLAEGGARILEGAFDAYQARHNPFVSARNIVRAFELDEHDGRKVYRRSSHMREWIYKDLEFPAEKAPGTLRVFCLGGSASMGWPYETPHSYPGFLERKLRRLLPDRTIEVLNLAGFSFASYRVKILFDEVIEYDPDLILIYSGNNEFLENFVYRNPSSASRLPVPLRNLALVRLAYNAWDLTRSPPVDLDIKNFAAADHISNRLSFAFGKASRLTEDPEQLRQVEAHYRYNLEAMARTCQERGKALFLLNVPVNSKDWNPNVSAHDPALDEAQIASWQVPFRAGVLALEAGRFAEALAAFDQAVALDGRHAESHYLRAVALHHLGRIDAARDGYRRALENDAFPFRALPSFQRIIADVAAAHQTPLVDIIAALEAEAGDGILGLDLLLDYVHLRAVGNEIVAHEVVHKMQETGFVPADLSLDAARIPVPPELDDSPFLLARLYEQFRVMRQYDRLEGLADRLRQQPGPDEIRARVEASQRVLMPYRRLLRAERLGLLEQEFSREEAEQILRDYVELTRALEAGSLSDEEFRRYLPGFEYSAADGTRTVLEVDAPEAQFVSVQGRDFPVHWEGNIRRVLFPEGGIYAEGAWVSGRREGIHRGYYEDGTPRMSFEWVAGRKEGLAETFFPNGELQSRGSFAEDLPVGLWVSYHPGGGLRSRGHFEAGERTGPWEFRDEQGHLDPVTSGTYENGEKISE